MNFTRNQLFAMIKVIPATDCWEFQGKADKNGFGRIYADNREYKAHRVFYEEWVETLSKVQYLHHHLPPEKCIGERCCNPSHMMVDEVRTIRRPIGLLPHLLSVLVSGTIQDVVNGGTSSRLDTPNSQCPKQCPKGHFMTEDNIVVEKRKGHPMERCRKCRQASWRKNSTRRATEGLHT